MIPRKNPQDGRWYWYDIETGTYGTALSEAELSARGFSNTPVGSAGSIMETADALVAKAFGGEQIPPELGAILEEINRTLEPNIGANTADRKSVV